MNGYGIKGKNPRPTIQPRLGGSSLSFPIPHSMFDVGRSMFDVHFF
jgi:hypothetical protein